MNSTGNADDRASAIVGMQRERWAAWHGVPSRRRFLSRIYEPLQEVRAGAEIYLLRLSTDSQQVRHACPEAISPERPLME